MSDRADSLRKDLDSLVQEWMFGDEGRVLIRPTKADQALVQKLAEEMPQKEMEREVAVLLAELLAVYIQQQGKRPADYWRMEGLAETVAKKLAKALQGSSDTFSSTFQATLKGIG
jgi:hypothetical protein